MLSTIPPPLVPFGQQEWLFYHLGTVFVDNGMEKGRAIDENIQKVVASLRGESLPPLLFDQTAYYDMYVALIDSCNQADWELRARRPLASRGRSTSPSQLSRSTNVPRTPERAVRKRELRCDHCRLPANLPPFYVVRSTESKKSGVFDKYCSLTMGVKNADDLPTAMWRAVSLLRPRLASEKLTPQAAEEHFTKRIGPPPWLEYFATMGQTVRSEERTMRERLVHNAHALEQLHERQVLTKQRIGIARKLLQLNNPDDERHRLQMEVSAAKEDLAKRHEELTAIVAKNRRDLALVDINKAMYAIRIEELRRYCALLTDEVNTREAEPQDMFSTPLDLALVRNKLLRILQDLPSAEFGRSTKRQQHGGTYSQCKDCMVLHAQSHFCTKTGDPHDYSAADAEPDMGASFLHRGGGAAYELSGAAVAPSSRPPSQAGAQVAAVAEDGLDSRSRGAGSRARKKALTKNPEIDALLEYMSIMADHLETFLSAAVRRDFKEMRELAESANSGLISQRFPSYAAQLYETETMFHDWLSVMSGGGAPVRKEMQIKDKKMLTVEALKAAEMRIHVLRREIREATQALEKRPNVKSNGITVDMFTFGMIVTKITDLTRRNAALRARTIKAEAARKRAIEDREERERKGIKGHGTLTTFSMLKSLSSLRM
jgi:hypothetical protein